MKGKKAGEKQKMGKAGDEMRCRESLGTRTRE